MGKSTISMAIFHCYVSSPEGRENGQPRRSQRCWISQDFLWILPGHGRRFSFRSAAERRAALTAAADAFRADPAGHGAPGPVFQVRWATNQLVG